MTAAAAGFHWRTGRGVLQFSKPCVMGILNVTPDSFYDGGHHSGLAAVLHHTEMLLAEGADIIDIGGESTRPGAAPVAEADEIARVVPVVHAVLERWPDAVISVDTVKSAVADAAAQAGAAIVNDVSAMRLDAAMANIVAANGLGIVLMHSRGNVAEMARYEMADYGNDPVGEMVNELGIASTAAREAGVADEQIVIDPGVGFSKRTEHSVRALAELDRFTALGYPVLVGPSRKRFVGELSGGLAAPDRLEGTLGALVAALAHGAMLFRVHDVLAARRALDVAHAILNPS
jgi:dihydropteroate synthase